MKVQRGMFRIYKCPHCSNIGYSAVEQESDQSNCSLCKGMILHTHGTIYAVTIQEAQEYLQELATQAARTRLRERPERGLGVRRRVLNIIASLEELNRGRPVEIHSVFKECNDAGIEIERVKHFMASLENQGLLTRNGDKVSVVEER